jgi:hypothetical protein
LYAPENETKVFEQKQWWQDDWNPMDSGFEYDENKSVNEQFYNLRQEIPRLNLITLDNENCDYTTGT